MPERGVGVATTRSISLETAPERRPEIQIRRDTRKVVAKEVALNLARLCRERLLEAQGAGLAHDHDRKDELIGLCHRSFDLSIRVAARLELVELTIGRARIGVQEIGGSPTTDSEESEAP